ncbi:hypothetical protein BDV30DRAFT_215984, partial [Aspergillus minisclerotigenes]
MAWYDTCIRLNYGGYRLAKDQASRINVPLFVCCACVLAQDVFGYVIRARSRTRLCGKPFMLRGRL